MSDEDYERGKADGARETDEKWMRLLGDAVRFGRGEITTQELRRRAPDGDGH